MQGKAIIFSAPSGAGKTTIVHYLLNQNLNLAFSVSACSRPKRPNEINGKDYYFLSTEEFKAKINANEFLEWEEVYKDNFYGTLKSEIERIWKMGKHVIFDVDVVGGLNLKKHFGERALAIFVKPPSLQVLKERLTARSTESAEKIAIRLAKAEKELTYANQFDYILLNDNMQKAFKEAKEIVSKFLNE
jgi:guanylate kinase